MPSSENTVSVTIVAADDRAEVERDHRHVRDPGHCGTACFIVTERSRKPLRPGRAHVVRVDHLQHRGAHEARVGGDAPRPSGRGRAARGGARGRARKRQPRPRFDRSSGWRSGRSGAPFASKICTTATWSMEGEPEHGRGEAEEARRRHRVVEDGSTGAGRSTPRLAPRRAAASTFGDEHELGQRCPPSGRREVGQDRLVGQERRPELIGRPGVLDPVPGTVRRAGRRGASASRMFCRESDLRHVGEMRELRRAGRRTRPTKKAKTSMLAATRTTTE